MLPPLILSFSFSRTSRNESATIPTTRKGNRRKWSQIFQIFFDPNSRTSRGRITPSVANLCSRAVSPLKSHCCTLILSKHPRLFEPK